jgi:hypothetical protein
MHTAAEGDALLWFAYPKQSSKTLRCDFNRDNGWDVLGTLEVKKSLQLWVEELKSAPRARSRTEAALALGTFAFAPWECVLSQTGLPVPFQVFLIYLALPAAAAAVVGAVLLAAAACCVRAQSCPQACVGSATTVASGPQRDAPA